MSQASSDIRPSWQDGPIFGWRAHIDSDREEEFWSLGRENVLTRTCGSAIMALSPCDHACTSHLKRTVRTLVLFLRGDRRLSRHLTRHAVLMTGGNRRVRCTRFTAGVRNRGPLKLRHALQRGRSRRSRGCGRPVHIWFVPTSICERLIFSSCLRTPRL